MRPRCCEAVTFLPWHAKRLFPRLGQGPHGPQLDVWAGPTWAGDPPISSTVPSVPSQMPHGRGMGDEGGLQGLHVDGASWGQEIMVKMTMP